MGFAKIVLSNNFNSFGHRVKVNFKVLQATHLQVSCGELLNLIAYPDNSTGNNLNMQETKTK